MIQSAATLHHLGTLELSVRLTFSCPKIHRIVASMCNFWFCFGHANLGSRFSLKDARTRTQKQARGGIPMNFKQPPFEFESQIRPLDLSSVENIADSIALLRDENDRLRRMAALLSAQTEHMRRSLLPTKSADWRPSSRLRALP
jgi:uncharacterized small protein (DUF1192 family)